MFLLTYPVNRPVLIFRGVSFPNSLTASVSSDYTESSIAAPPKNSGYSSSP